MNLYELMAQSAKKNPQKVAIIDSERRITYEELITEIDGLARDLKSYGVREKDKIGLMLPNSSSYIAISYAIWANDACIVPISTDLTPKEAQDIMQSTDLDAVIAHKPILLEGLKRGNIHHSGSPFSQHFLFYSFDDKTRSHHGELNMAFLRFTSGTTSTSKGVILCHETVLERITAANRVLKIDQKDNIIWMLSMAHHFTVSIVLYLTNGATITLCKSHLARAVLETINREKGTIIYTTPFHLKLLSEDTSSLGMPSVRLVISTAMALSENIARRFYARFSVPITQAYGIIEIGLPCINLNAPLAKINSVGQVLPDYEVNLVDPNNPDIVNPESGEIFIKGPGTLDAYYSPWTPRHQIMVNGWFATGDLGKFDEDGNLYIIGRKKDLINIAGMKFFPHEVESIIDKHERVKESYVYPVSHESLGEVLHAQVVLQGGLQNCGSITDDISNYCKKNLAAYKVPRKIEVVHEIPKTFTGKIKRHQQPYPERNVSRDAIAY